MVNIKKFIVIKKIHFQEHYLGCDIQVLRKYYANKKTELKRNPRSLRVAIRKIHQGNDENKFFMKRRPK